MDDAQAKRIEEARAKMEEGLRELVNATRAGELTAKEAAEHLGKALLEGFRAVASDAEIRKPPVDP